MSRLFATYLMNENGITPDELLGVFTRSDLSFSIRYFKVDKKYEFNVLDFYGYVQERSVFCYKVKIDEGDLLRLLRVDNYSDDEKNELYYHKLLSSTPSGEGLEQKSLDDDVYWGISLLQYFFHISKAVMNSAKKQYHLFELRRVESKEVLLRQRILHSRGGRKLGSVSGIEWQNVENADKIIRTCVEKDRYWEFMDLHKELIRARVCKLNMTGIKWKFYILRYKYKVNNGFITCNKEYEKELLSKNEKYHIFDNLTF